MKKLCFPHSVSELNSSPGLKEKNGQGKKLRLLGLKLSQIRSAYYPVVHKYKNICLLRLHSSSKTIFDWLVECSTYEFLLVPDWLLYHEALFENREKTGNVFFFLQNIIFFSKASSNRRLQILTCLTIPQAWSAKM